MCSSRPRLHNYASRRAKGHCRTIPQTEHGESPPPFPPGTPRVPHVKKGGEPGRGACRELVFLRGLGTLIGVLHPDDASGFTYPPAAYQQIDVQLVDPNPGQPRTVFDEDDLTELAATIRTYGVLLPIRVRPAGQRYELIAGERRIRAARLAGHTTIPAIVVDVTTDQSRVEALVENLARKDLNPLEEAHAYAALVDSGYTHDQIAEVVGKSRSHVTNMLRLLRLPAKVADRVAAGVLSAGHAKLLAGIADPFAAIRLSQRIIAEGLSVSSTAEIIALGDLPGAEGELPKRPRTRRTLPLPDTAESAQELLTDWLETSISIKTSNAAGRGRIRIEFADAHDLDRIMVLLKQGPGTTAPHLNPAQAFSL